MNSSDKIRKRLQLEDELLDNALKIKSLIKRGNLNQADANDSWMLGGRRWTKKKLLHTAL